MSVCDLIEWQEFEKTVGENALKFRQDCEDFMITSSLFGASMCFVSVCLMLVDNELFDDFFENCKSEEKSFCNKLFIKLKENFECCLLDFEKKTNIHIYLDSSLINSYNSVGGYLCLEVGETKNYHYQYKEGMMEKVNDLQRKGIVFTNYDSRQRVYR
jgi:hypothetical protein